MEKLYVANLVTYIRYDAPKTRKGEHHGEREKYEKGRPEEEEGCEE